jgi:hypothetical protein
MESHDAILSLKFLAKHPPAACTLLIELTRGRPKRQPKFIRHFWLLKPKKR